MINYRSELRRLIPDVLKEMIRIRRREYKNLWRDTNSTGLIISCEAMLSFLIPANAISEIRNEIFSIIDEETIISSLFDEGQIMDLCREDFYGSPYINFSGATPDSRDKGFIDAASFVLSVLNYASQFYWDAFSKEQKENIQETADRALQFIDDAFIKGKGWSWGAYDKPDRPFIYCTWTAIECLSDLVEDSSTISKISLSWDTRRHSITENLEAAHTYLVNTFIDSPKPGMSIHKETIRFDDVDFGLHYNLWLAISLLLLNSPRVKEIGESMDIIWSEFTKNDRSRRYYLSKPMSVFFDGKKYVKPSEVTEFKDRAFLPLVLKCLSLYVGRYPDTIDKYNPILENVYKELLLNRNFSKYEYVWDKYAEGDCGYAIYYTERAIEALVRLYEVMPEAPSGRPESAICKEIGINIPIAAIRDAIFSDKEFMEQFLQQRKVESKTARTLEEDMRAAKQEISDLKDSINAINSKLDKVLSSDAVKLAIEMENAGKKGPKG